MAVIGQASSAIPNFSKFIISGWYRAPQATVDGFLGGIIEFGQTTDGPSYIYINTSGGIETLILGAHEGYTGSTINRTDIPTPEHGSPSNDQTENDPLTASIFHGTNTFEITVLPAAAWHWFGMSGDFSGTCNVERIDTEGVATEFVVHSWDHRFWLAVDDVDYSLTRLIMGIGADETTIDMPAGVYNPTGVAAPNEDGDVGAPGGVNGLILPPATFSISGSEFGFPVKPSNADPGYNGIAQYAEFQMWVGKSTDFSEQANRRRFIDSRGKPVNPATPRAVFGAPNILFSRNSKNKKLFQTNQGTGGAFARSGVISDFTPGPDA